MTASAETELQARLTTALLARQSLDKAQVGERKAMVNFVDEALHHAWSWTRIGQALGISATGARRYYQRNRAAVRRAA